MGALVGTAVLGVGAFMLRGTSNDSSCLAEAGAYLPVVETEQGLAAFLWGGDMELARAAGFDDSGPFDSIVPSHMETGVLPGPHYFTALSRADESAAPPAVAGFESSDVSCWIGRQTERSAAALGDFDRGEVSGSELGRDGEVATNDNVLVHSSDGDAAALLAEPSGLDGAVADILDTFDDHGVVSFAIVNLGDEPRPPAGLALTQEDGWELLVVWLFPDTSTAEEGREALATMFAEGNSSLPALVDGDAPDHLDQDGSTLSFKAPLKNPASWLGILTRFDRALNPLDD